MNVKSILGFSLGPLIGALFSVAIVPIVAWIFAPEDVGRLNIFHVTVSFVLLLSVLGLDQAYVREYHESRNKMRLLRTCFWPGFFLLFMVVSFSAPFAGFLSVFLYGLDSVWFYLLTAMTFFASYCSRFLSLILRMQERGIAYSMSEVLPKFCQLLFLGFIALMSDQKSFLHLLALIAFSMYMVLLVYAWNTRIEWLGAINEKVIADEQQKVFRFGFPLILSSLIYWAVTASGSYVLRWLSDFSELAIYSVAISFAGAAAIFQVIFTTVWAPTVYKWAANNADMNMVDRVGQQALAIVCVLVAFILACSWLTDYFLPKHYSVVKYILLCCCLQPILYALSEVTCIGIALSRRTGWAIWISLAAFLSGLVSLCLLVPVYGARGAAISNALAFLVFFVGRTEVSARVWRSFPRFKMYSSVFGLTVISIFVALQNNMHPFHYLSFGVLLLVFSIAFFMRQWLDIISGSIRFLSGRSSNGSAV